MHLIGWSSCPLVYKVFGDNGADDLYSDVSSSCTNGRHHILASRFIYYMIRVVEEPPAQSKGTGMCPTSQCCYVVVCVRSYGCLTVDVSRYHAGCFGVQVATCCVFSSVLLILLIVLYGRFVVFVALRWTTLQRITNADTSTSCGESTKPRLH